jgi:succinate dehydrogenase / fumarate reductase, cytochrome b subunit
MAQREKPLVRPMSPFWHYRFWPSMALSILHRFTGLALTVGSVLLVYWLTAAALGPEAYARAQSVFACGVTQVALLGFVFSFCYHLLNGVRHLVWDTGRGFDLAVARKSSYFVIIGAVVLTTVVVAVFCVRLGGAA